MARPTTESSRLGPEENPVFSFLMPMSAHLPSCFLSLDGNLLLPRVKDDRSSERAKPDTATREAATTTSPRRPAPRSYAAKPDAGQPLYGCTVTTGRGPPKAVAAWGNHVHLPALDGEGICASRAADDRPSTAPFWAGSDGWLSFISRRLAHIRMAT